MEGSILLKRAILPSSLAKKTDFKSLFFAVFSKKERFFWPYGTTFRADEGQKGTIRIEKSLFFRKNSDFNRSKSLFFRKKSGFLAFRGP